jgi:hypothetical protein
VDFLALNAVTQFVTYSLPLKNIQVQHCMVASIVASGDSSNRRGKKLAHLKEYLQKADK